MTAEPRRKRRRSVDREPCGEFHNPGHWPYIAACVLDDRHRGDHRDAQGNEWERYPTNQTTTNVA